MPTPGPAEQDLVRVLGVRQLAFQIFNYTVGTGIFVLPAILVSQLGAAAPLAYVTCAVIMTLVVLTFAESGSRVARTGGPYAYVEVGLGPLAGFIVGVLLVLASLAASGAVVTALAGSLRRAMGLAAPVWEPLFIIVVLLFAAVMNIRGIKRGARMVEIFSVAKLTPLVFFVVVGAFWASSRNFESSSTPDAATIGAAAGTLIFAFAGIETALFPSGEVRDPTRTLPRGALIALAATTLLYLGVQAVALGVMGPALANDTVAPLATAASQFAGTPGSVLLLAGATISMLGWVMGDILAGPRAVFALARDGFLHRGMAIVHPTFRTPHVAIAVYATSAAVVALSGTFQRLVVLANITTLACYFVCAIAMWRLRRRNIQTAGQPFVVPGGPILPLATCSATAWVIWQTVTAREFFWLLVVAAACVPVYLLRRPRTSWSPPEMPASH